ncbi:MAG: S8 family serine peptidase [Bacteroidota bacterium]
MILLVPIHTFCQNNYVANEIIIRYKVGTEPSSIEDYLNQIDAVPQEHIAAENMIRYRVGDFPMIIDDPVNGSVTIHNTIDLLGHTLQQAEVDGGSLNYEINIPEAYDTDMNLSTFLPMSLMHCQNYLGHFLPNIGGTASLKIGIIDTGVATDVIASHFGEWIEETIDLVDDGLDGDDGNGHGTKVASIIVDMLSYMGVTSASLVSVKAFDNTGSTNIFKLFEAIDKLEQLNANIVNMSFGYAPHPEDIYSNLLVKKIKELQNSEMLMVTSAGNNGIDISQDKYYPASLSNADCVLTVGALNCNSGYTSFSNYSPDLVELSAPGQNIVGLAPNGELTLCTGTSYAVPLVVSLAAVYGSHLSFFDASDVACMLKNSATSEEYLTDFVMNGNTLNYVDGIAPMDCTNSTQTNSLLAQSNTALAQSNETSATRIYPNPFYNNDLSLLIDIEREVVAQINFYDLSGSLILSVDQLFDAGSDIISLNIPSIERWSPGVYIAKVRMGNQILSYKLIKR